MPEPDRYAFSLEELLEMMVKKAGVTAGRWMFSVEFGIGALNAAQPGSDIIRPAAIVPLVGIGIQRVAETDPSNNLTFDASQLAKIW